MDGIDELNTSAEKLNLLTYTKIVCTLGVWWNICKKIFSRDWEELLGLDRDGSYSLRVFYWAKLISAKILKKGS
jgi:hypothetical protein